jgi:hypothetical protein
MAVLAGILHEKRTSTELGQLIATLADQIPSSSVPLPNPWWSWRRNFSFGL